MPKGKSMSRRGDLYSAAEHRRKHDPSDRGSERWIRNYNLELERDRRQNPLDHIQPHPDDFVDSQAPPRKRKGR